MFGTEYSVQIEEITDQDNFVFGKFSRSMDLQDYGQFFITLFSI